MKNNVELGMLSISLLSARPRWTHGHSGVERAAGANWARWRWIQSNRAVGADWTEGPDGLW